MVQVIHHLISILGCQIRSHILEKLKRTEWFTVIADEATNISNKEQLSLVLRYIDPDDGIVREDLRDFIECNTGITGRSLVDKVLGAIDVMVLISPSPEVRHMMVQETCLVQLEE